MEIHVAILGPIFLLAVAAKLDGVPVRPGISADAVTVHHHHQSFVSRLQLFFGQVFGKDHTVHLVKQGGHAKHLKKVDRL